MQWEFVAFLGTAPLLDIEADILYSVSSSSLVLPFDNYRGEHCLYFAYYMFGFHVDSIVVETENNGAVDEDWICEKEQGRQWFIASIDLNIRQADKVKLRWSRGSFLSV